MNFIKIDVDDYGDLQDECKINFLPTFIMYDKNKVMKDKLEVLFFFSHYGLGEGFWYFRP